MRLFLDLAQIRQRALELVGQVFELEHGFDSRQKLELVDRFAEKVVGAAFVGSDLVIDAGQRGQHDDRDEMCLAVALDVFARPHCR